jgi:hypothetical protein
MKNVLISLLALAAISGSALADSGTSHDDRGISLQKPAYGTAKNSTSTKAFAVPSDSTPLTAFELMMKNAEGSDRNSHDRSRNNNPA